MRIKSLRPARLTAAAGTGASQTPAVVAVEKAGTIYTTVLKLDNLQVTVTNVTGASFGGKLLYTFPAGRILVLQVVANIRADWFGQDITATGSGDFSLGSTITSDATLTGNDANLLASSALTDPFVAGRGTGTGALTVPTSFDGTTTPVPVNLNLIIDDADVANGASDVVTVGGTVTITWVSCGDY